MRAATTTLAAILLSAGLAAARGPGQGAGGPGMGMGRCPVCAGFDAKTAADVPGTVEKVVRVDQGRHEGIHWMLKTEEGPVEVHVGPAWWLERQDPAVSEGDAVTVRGSWVTLEGKKALVAAAVTKGDDTLELRGEDGRPRWLGWRRKAWR